MNTVVGGVAFGAVAGGAVGGLVFGGVAGALGGGGGATVPVLGSTGATAGAALGVFAVGAVAVAFAVALVAGTVAVGAEFGVVVAVGFFFAACDFFAFAWTVVVGLATSGIVTGTFGGAAATTAPDAAGAWAPSVATIAKNDDVLSPAATSRPPSAG